MFKVPVPGTRAGDNIQVMSRGFMLHDRLLHAAKVSVSSTPAPEGLRPFPLSRVANCGPTCEPVGDRLGGARPAAPPDGFEGRGPP